LRSSAKHVFFSPANYAILGENAHPSVGIFTPLFKVMKLESAFASILELTEEKEATLSSRCSMRASFSPASFSSKSDMLNSRQSTTECNSEVQLNMSNQNEISQNSPKKGKFLKSLAFFSLKKPRHRKAVIPRSLIIVWCSIVTP
jgi:hypothetical protein